ncbi:universal stress protein in QAH/OAS sulfhydrylase 3'region-like [Mya arenaria]|uniref:universal stress protein in QAH/OAS sulfhydrylase 3'region-like n=1 Tax=Mya arenaria TaxID=6604 RepID=UPI0022DF0D3D|nr:universal stress protein in QAH/OAS sulfhydrylase 3'region-like [Mya arenaria]
MAEAEGTHGRTILVAMDGSKHSKHAFEWFADHLYCPTDRVLLAYCAEPVHISTILTGEPMMAHQLLKQEEQKMKEVFDNIDIMAKSRNVKHHLLRLDGQPGQAIVKEAEKQGANLIITGSRGVGGIRRTLIGSISDYIIHHSHVPVVVCKHEDEHHKLK